MKKLLLVQCCKSNKATAYLCLIHSLGKHFLSTYCETSTLLGVGDGAGKALDPGKLQSGPHSEGEAANRWRSMLRERWRQISLKEKMKGCMCFKRSSRETSPRWSDPRKRGSHSWTLMKKRTPPHGKSWGRERGLRREGPLRTVSTCKWHFLAWILMLQALLLRAF